MSSITLKKGDCIERLKELESNSVHAVVTDPPYALGLFGNDWDTFELHEYKDFCEEWAEECLRVLKPGGYLLAFGSSRTHGGLFMALYDAGYTIRNTLTWHYAEGFPKGQDIGKSIRRWSDEDGEEWDGWRSQLKPASEFIIMAQKPLSESSIYKNCLKHGVGALNIDACRVPSDGEHKDNHPEERGTSHIGFSSGGTSDIQEDRYPSNLMLSEGGIIALDNITEPDNVTKQKKQSEVNSSESNITHKEDTGSLWNKQDYEDDGLRQYGDGGSKSRFFPTFEDPPFIYSAKASKSERTHEGEVDNNHPSVKPIDVMSWLVKLVTREGQTVLDPFAGSATTGISCVRTERDVILIEKDDEYIDICKDRLEEESGENVDIT